MRRVYGRVDTSITSVVPMASPRGTNPLSFSQIIPLNIVFHTNLYELLSDEEPTPAVVSEHGMAVEASRVVWVVHDVRMGLRADGPGLVFEVLAPRRSFSHVTLLSGTMKPPSEVWLCHPLVLRRRCSTLRC